MDSQLALCLGDDILIEEVCRDTTSHAIGFIGGFCVVQVESDTRWDGRGSQAGFEGLDTAEHQTGGTSASPLVMYTGFEDWADECDRYPTCTVHVKLDWNAHC
jgi:hypothetical protein